MKRQKQGYAILNAFACDPELGSEKGIGWTWLNYISRFYQIILLTEDNERSEVLKTAVHNDEQLRKQVEIIFIKPRRNRFFSTLKRVPGLRTILYYSEYRSYLAAAYKRCQDLISEKEIFLVHHCTFGVFREPGLFWDLPVPALWGPVGGFGGVPIRFAFRMGGMEFFRHFLRNCSNLYAEIKFKYLSKAPRQYDYVIAGSEKTAQILNEIRDEETGVIPYNLVKKPVCRKIFSGGNHECLQLMFCGRHESRKGGDILIRAFSKIAKDHRVILHMVGDGPMTRKWKEIAERMSCNEKVVWHGRLDRKRVYKVYQIADLFIFPSLHDIYPTVIAEAIQYGIPVITSDKADVCEMVKDKGGICVSSKSTRELEDGLVRSVKLLLGNFQKMTMLHEEVQLVQREFAVEGKMRLLYDIYNKCFIKFNNNRH